MLTKYLFYFLASIILVVLSAFFSGVETGIYRFSRIRLRICVEEGKNLYRLLSKLFNDSQGLVFSTLLGNNIANCLATSVITSFVMIAVPQSDNSQYYATLIMTPTLFIFGEVIPKSLFYRYSEPLMTKSSPVIWLFYKTFSVTGLIKLLKAISSAMEKLFRVSKARDESATALVKKHIEGILQDTQDEGYLSYVQDDIVNRVVNIFNVKITSVMVGFGSVAKVDVSISRDSFFEYFKSQPHTRILVYEGKQSNVIGHVNVYKAVCHEGDFDLRNFVTPIYRFTPETPVIRALGKMHHDDLRIAMIAKARRKSKFQPLGIVTIKDLAEEITGEMSVC